MATFPTYAEVVLQNYSEDPDYGVLRTEMDSGIAKQRARWSKPIVTRDVQILVRTAANKALFDTWVRDDLSGGAGWFDWIDPLTSAVKQTRIVGGKVSWSAPNGIWVAQAQLETLG